MPTTRPRTPPCSTTPPRLCCAASSAPCGTPKSSCARWPPGQLCRPRIALWKPFRCYNKQSVCTCTRRPSRHPLSRKTNACKATWPGRRATSGAGSASRSPIGSGARVVAGTPRRGAAGRLGTTGTGLAAGARRHARRWLLAALQAVQDVADGCVPCRATLQARLRASLPQATPRLQLGSHVTTEFERRWRGGGQP